MRDSLRSPFLPSTLVFLVFIFGFTLLNLLTPSRDVSVTERRTLAQRPQLTVDSVMSGEFASAYSTYMQDQAALREPLRFLKSSVQRKVLRNPENNGVYVIDGFVVDKFYGIEERRVDTAGRRMNEIIADVRPSAAYLAVIPTKAQALVDGALTDAPAHGKYLLSDQNVIIDHLRRTVDASYIDLSTLADENVRSRYYRTDPHLTTRGAIDAYETLARGLNLDPVTTVGFEPLTDRFIGSEYGRAAAWSVPLDTIELAHDPTIDGMTLCRQESADHTDCSPSVYVLPTADTVDQYDVFLGGLAPIIEITNDRAPAGTKLVIFKDSYAHAIAPFLAQHYRRVTLVDLRYVQRAYVLDHVDFSNATVLFLYSTSVINTDPRALN